jgi:hypothetical protein
MRVEVDNRLATVRTIGSGRVLLDFNPPLAGKTLSYEVTVKKKLKTAEEKMRALVHRRIPQIDVSKFSLGITAEALNVGVPESSSQKLRQSRSPRLSRSWRKPQNNFPPRSPKRTLKSLSNVQNLAFVSCLQSKRKARFVAFASLVSAFGSLKNYSRAKHRLFSGQRRRYLGINDFYNPHFSFILFAG